jgi:hypothetical protein
MKFSLKTLAAAVALVAVAGTASAAINDGSTGNGGLFFNAWDGQKSYNFDMAMSIDAYESNLAAAGNQNLLWGASFLSSYTSWLATANTTTLQWSVLAVDTDAQRRILTTVGAAVLPATNSNSDVLRTGAANIQTYINNVNPILTGNFGITTSNTADSYTGKIIGDKINNKFNFDTSASFANNSYANGVVFQKTLANGGGITKGTNNAYSDGGVAVRSWVDGAGLHIAAVQAVPEPSEYAMLLAGLGLIGAVARRRSQKQA